MLLTESLSYHGLRRIASFLNISVKGIAMDDDGAAPEAFEDARYSLRRHSITQPQSRCRMNDGSRLPISRGDMAL